MKNLLTLLLVLVSLNALSQGTEQDKVKAVVIEFFDGLSELSDQKIRSTVTEDFLLLEHGEVWNTDTLLAKIAPARKQTFKRENFFEFIEIKMKGDVAWISYKNKAVFSTKERSRAVNWLESAVLLKQKGEWKISLLHSTVIENDK